MRRSDPLAITIQGLSKQYNKIDDRTGERVPFFAVRSVDLSIRQGEVLGIIGKNGSGKSTLLRILAGITKPTHGTVEIRGSVASILDIGTGFHPDPSGRDNIYLRGQLLGMSKVKVDEVFDALVQFSGVGEFIGSPVKHYSDGMFLRLAFSIIIHLKADILLIDEVIAVGDAGFKKKCAHKIAEMVKDGRTVVLVSHDLDGLASLCDSIVQLEQGQVQRIGSRNVIQQYLNAELDNSEPNEAVPAFTLKDLTEKGDAKNLTILSSGIDGHQLREHGLANELPITVFFKLKVLSDIELNISLSVYKQSGGLLCINSTTHDKDNKMIGHGIYRVAFELPTHLFNQGTYTCDAYFHSSDERVVIRADRFLQFYLVNKHYDGFDQYDLYTSAIFKPMTGFSIQKLQ